MLVVKDKYRATLVSGSAIFTSESGRSAATRESKRQMVSKAVPGAGYGEDGVYRSSLRPARVSL